MTWLEFKDLVKSYMPEHNRRHGIQPLIDLWIKASVVDLQRFVEYFQSFHADRFAASTLQTDGYSTRVSMPAGRPLIFRLLKTGSDNTPDPTNYVHLPRLEWNLRWRSVDGTLPRGTRGVLIEPQARFCFVLPTIRSDEWLEICWAGLKQDFADTDQVIFADTEAQAVADYVMARLARQVDKDMQLAGSFESTYRGLRRNLYLRYRERTFVPDVPYLVAPYNPTSTDGSGDFSSDFSDDFGGVPSGAQSEDFSDDYGPDFGSPS